MTKRALITLIHGTFARNADWTAETSAFCKAIVTGLDIDAKFSRLQWSGRNSAMDRIAAADKLAASLRAEQLNDPQCIQIVIGHSHGGSVLAYALARYPDLAKTVAGAFLSTPFIDARPRRNWFLIAMIVTLALASMPIAALSALQTLFIYFYLQSRMDKPALFELVWELLFIANLSVAYFAIFLAPRAIIKSNPKRIARSLSTCRLPTGQYLFLRTTGDEASGALSTAQFSSWLFSRIVYAATSIFPNRLRRRPFKDSGPLKLRRLLGIFRVKISVLILMSLPFISSSYIADIMASIEGYLRMSKQVHPNDTMPSLWQTLVYAEEHATFGDLLGSIAFLVALLFAVIWLIVFCYFLLLIIFFSLSWFSHRAFGRSSFGAIMFLEMAVEPVPIGTHTVVHASWGNQYAGLAHSLAYQNPKTISAVRGWISAITRLPEA